MTPLTWPNGRRFALSIIDDTDRATLRNVRPFYDALRRHGLRTTKTVWSLPSPPDDRFAGDSLADDAYRAWIHELVAAGFEIGWHGARSGGTTRSLVAHAQDVFRDVVGTWPRTYANHAQNEECLYWGEERFDTAAMRTIYRLTRQGQTRFSGTTPSSPYYWGDLCRGRIDYVRGFTFADIVTTAADPYMPFHDANRPDVRAWFSASDGPDVERFLALLTPEHLDRLERSGGACIVYTHVASGFVRDGVLDPRVDATLAELAKRDGWYVPVATILEHIERHRGLHTIRRAEHAALERRWLGDRVRAAMRRRAS